MAKTHAYSGFNGWHVLSSLVLFVDSWYSKVIEIKLMNYFSKLEHNEAFSAEIILYFIRNKGNYLTFLKFSQFRRRSILQQKEICEAYTFHIIYMIQCMKHKNNVLLQIFGSLCIKTQENHGKHKCSSIAMQIFICRQSIAMKSVFDCRVSQPLSFSNRCNFVALQYRAYSKGTDYP